MLNGIGSVHKNRIVDCSTPTSKVHQKGAGKQQTRSRFLSSKTKSSCAVSSANTTYMVSVDADNCYTHTYPHAHNHIKRTKPNIFKFECAIFLNGNENNECFFISKTATMNIRRNLRFFFPFFRFSFITMVSLIFFITLKIKKHTSAVQRKIYSKSEHSETHTNTYRLNKMGGETERTKMEKERKRQKKVSK